MTICLCGNQNEVSIESYHDDFAALQDCIKILSGSK